jgi:hypothetical protein
MIAAPSLEIAVLVLGMLILMLDCFVESIDKRALAFAAIAGLAAILVATFFLTPVQEKIKPLAFGRLRPIRSPFSLSDSLF